MRIDILSKEYPPAIYGGAGVHVAELVRALRQRGDLDVRVHAFGEPRDEDGTTGHPDLAELSGANAALTTLGVDLSLAAACEGADLVHSHTWYANMGGHLASLMGDIPHVLTAHSLEPMRPWKAEQLGGGYRVSSWVEKTAYEAADAVIAVSAGMREDILRSYPSVDPDRVKVVHNGIDSQLWQRETRRGRRAQARGRPRPAQCHLRRAASPGRRGCLTSCARRPSYRRRCSSCCSPAPPTLPRSRPRSRA